MRRGPASVFGSPPGDAPDSLPDGGGLPASGVGASSLGLSPWPALAGGGGGPPGTPPGRAGAGGGGGAAAVAPVWTVSRRSASSVLAESAAVPPYSAGAPSAA